MKSKTAILLLLLAGTVSARTGFCDCTGKGADLPARVNIRLVKTLEQHLSEIEKRLVDQGGFKKEQVRNVTMALQNYIDDVVLASGKYTDVYPQVIYEILCERLGSGKPKREVAGLLVDYQKAGQFRVIAESKKGGSPHGGNGFNEREGVDCSFGGLRGPLACSGGVRAAH